MLRCELHCARSLACNCHAEANPGLGLKNLTLIPSGTNNRQPCKGLIANAAAAIKCAASAAAATTAAAATAIAAAAADAQQHLRCKPSQCL